MSSTGTALKSSALKRELEVAISSGMGLEDVIRKMREIGCDKIDSIKLLRELKGLSLAEAKAAVHYSSAWSDCIESDNALHEAASAAAEELGFTEESTHNQLSR